MTAVEETGPYTALVLAGSRGPADPVAAHCGVLHKALVPVAGTAMIVRVVRSLGASRNVGRIFLCLDDPALLEGLPELAEMTAAGRLAVVAQGASPSLSVRQALQRIDQALPLLVTTADHPLLTTAMIDHFCAAIPTGADVAVALAPASLIRRERPGAVRTFYRLGGEAYSGCNLFAFRTGAASGAAAFWARVERHRKRPWRLVAAIGPLVVLRFALGRLDIAAAERAISRRAGAILRIVEMPFAEAAIDVDKPADLALAEAVLRERA